VPVALSESGVVVVESPSATALVREVVHDRYSSGRKEG
jgi:hypothetical protein